MSSTNDDFIHEEDPSLIYNKLISQNIPLSSGEVVFESLTPSNAEFADLSESYESTPIKQIIDLEITETPTSIQDLFPDAYQDRIVQSTAEPSRKEYFVVEKENYTGKEQVTQTVFDELEETSVPSCYDILDTNGDTIILCSAVPSRQVSVSRSYSKIVRGKSYFLTDQEAETLKTDFRVESVQIPPEQNGGFLTTDAVQGGNFSRAPNGYNDVFDSVTIILCNKTSVCGNDTWNGINFIPGEEVIQVLNSNSIDIQYNSATAKGTILKWSDGGDQIWPLVTLINLQGTFVETVNYRQQNEVPQYIKGVTSGAVFKLTPYSVGKFLQQDSNWGLPRSNAIGNAEDPVPENYNYVLDGSGVDVVIMDTGIYVNHPEFQDADGNSRVVQHNWYEAAGRPEEAYKQHPRFYTDQSGHGTHVAGTAAGKTFGWAKNAKIYSMKIMGAYSISWDEAFDLITEWHERKPVDTETGVKRPTIVNCSWSWHRVLRFGPPMIYGGRLNLGDTSKPASVWNTGTTASSLTGLNLLGVAYDKNSLPPSGNVVDPERNDPFNTGQKNGSFPTIRETTDIVNKTFYSFRHILWASLYRSQPDSQGRVLQFEVPTVRITISMVDTGIQTMIDAGIHVCIAAGNDRNWIVNSQDENYNDTATFKTYENDNSFGSIVNGNWVLGSSLNYSQSYTDEIQIRRKTSPYSVDAIIVGSINSRVLEEGNQGPWVPNWLTGTITTPGGSETKSNFSNYGTAVDIYAPGQDIMSCVPNYFGNNNGVYSPRLDPDVSEYCYTQYKTNPYYYNNNFAQTKLSGTSMASPQVCGFGALLLQLYPELTPQQLKYLILQIGNKETSLYDFKGAYGSADRWGINQYYVSTIGKNQFSPPNVFQSFDQNDATAILSQQDSITGAFFYGLGQTENVNILYNPYSVELPSEFSIEVPERLVSNSTVNMINVVNSSTGLNVIWTEVVADDLVGYIVERSTSPTSTFTALFQQPITERSFLDSSVPYDQTYYYRVRAVGANSTLSIPGEPLSGTRIKIDDEIVQVARVTGISATAILEGIRLNWNTIQSKDHSHYEIRRSTSLTGSYVKINLENITGTSFLDTDVAPLNKYYYKVYSVNYNGVYSLEPSIVSATALAEINVVDITSTGDLADLGWVTRGDVIKTSEASYTTDGEGIRMFNSSWCEIAINTTGYKDTKLKFALRTNKYNTNEFLAVLYYSESKWKLAFVGTSESYELKEIPLQSDSFDKSEIKLRFHTFTTTSDINKYTDIDNISIYGTEAS
jgi:hypothetical protein